MDLIDLDKLIYNLQEKKQENNNPWELEIFDENGDENINNAAKALFNNDKKSYKKYKKTLKKKINNNNTWGIKKEIVAFIFFGFAKTNLLKNNKEVFELKYKTIQKIMKNDFNITISIDHLNTIMNDFKKANLIERWKDNRKNKYYIILKTKMIDIIKDINKQCLLNQEKKQFINKWWDTLKTFCKSLKKTLFLMLKEIKQEMLETRKEWATLPENIEF